ncbi:MAG: C4-type zinc ribbon domain-containing protein [Planctomycetota bacterium]|nr:C4-type zinc ribbon domain-containing protein [Planctomycetota bacterium]
MSNDEQSQIIIQLVALRDVDTQRAEARSLIDSVPRILQARLKETTEAGKALETSKERLAGFKAHLGNLESDLATKEEALGKASSNLLNARSNDEYALMQIEIGRKREAKGAAESEIINQYDVINQGEELVKNAGDQIEAAQAEYQAFEERAMREMKEHIAELEEFEERREQVRKTLSPDALNIYDRAYKAHGEGIAVAEANVCQGCFSGLTPNDQSRMISGKEIIVCRTCHRILFLPETLQASPS